MNSNENDNSHKRKEYLDINTDTRSASEKRLKTLFKPPKAKNLEVVQKLKALKQRQTADFIVIAPVPEQKLEVEREYYECAFCGEKLYAPYPKPLKRLVDKVKQNEIDYRKEQETKHKELVEKLKKQGEKYFPPFTYIKCGISKNDQQMICRMHKVELIYKPQAKEKGYPERIDFENIPARVLELKSELQDIIDKKKTSEYLDRQVQVHQEVGSIKARQAKELINRFDETLPGYYGNRGSHFIMETLNDMFLKTNYITKETSKPLTPIEFLQQVLMPECGLRLIQQDMKLKDRQEAIQVMKESTEYGSIVYGKIKKKTKEE